MKSTRTVRLTASASSSGGGRQTNSLSCATRALSHCMKNLPVTLALLLAVAISPSNANPPFSGTIFVNKAIITDQDPTSFVRIENSGKGRRQMFDRRGPGRVDVEAHLFIAHFDDGRKIEVQVNPEFSADEALAEAKKYLPVIGQIPGTLRQDVETVWIHKGNHGFGGGNRNLLIHTDMGESYIKSGILAETFVHEAAHTSLDARHARDKDWLAAQEKDPGFISGYAKSNPKREDVAESFLLWIALRHKPDRVDAKLKDTIEKTIPNRMAYFDNLKLDLHPMRPRQEKAAN